MKLRFSQIQERFPASFSIGMLLCSHLPKPQMKVLPTLYTINCGSFLSQKFTLSLDRRSLTICTCS